MFQCRFDENKNYISIRFDERIQDGALESSIFFNYYYSDKIRKIFSVLHCSVNLVVKSHKNTDVEMLMLMSWSMSMSILMLMLL